jgi:hypothetical protein
VIQEKTSIMWEVMESGSVKKNSYEQEASVGYWWGNLRERDDWGDPGVDRRIILRRIFRKWDVGVWTGLGWLRTETGGMQL